MAKKDPRVDAYIAKAAAFAQPILNHLRELMHSACPDVEETWKWSFPCFMYKGAMLCNMAAFKEHCSFGFWKASLLADTDGIFPATGKVGMGHLGRLESLKDLPKDAILKKYIKAAMKLNEEGIKVAARAKPTEKEKQALVVPDYFTKALKKNKKAEKVFNEFPYSHKKEYVRWFEEAKTDVTRDKRIEQALEWIAEGKDHNWKYRDC